MCLTEDSSRTSKMNSISTHGIPKALPNTRYPTVSVTSEYEFRNVITKIVISCVYMSWCEYVSMHVQKLRF